MIKNRLPLFLLLLPLLLISCTTPTSPSTAIPTTQGMIAKSIQLKNDSGNLVNLTVEVAQTEQERERGLMYRTSLGEQQGMLFLFPNVAEQTFWMKNTLLPLDMIFVDEHNKIVTIAGADPCTADPCTLYTSGKPVKYVIEVKKGFASSHKISLGNEVLF